MKKIKKRLDFSIHIRYNIQAASGCGEVWYRAWFGTKRPWVQVPSLRPSQRKSPKPQGFRAFFVASYITCFFCEILKDQGATKKMGKMLRIRVTKRETARSCFERFLMIKRANGKDHHLYIAIINGLKASFNRSLCCHADPCAIVAADPAVVHIFGLNGNVCDLDSVSKGGRPCQRGDIDFNLEVFRRDLFQ